MEWGTVIGWIGGVASTAIILVLKAHLETRKEERRSRRATSLDDRQRRIETDRAIYRRRLTTLVRTNLATYIRSGRWRTDENDLVRSLARGGYEDFLDPEVNARWVRLIARTVELARKRRDETIAPVEIEEYNELHRAWEDAAKRSFGPLPETAEVTPRRDRADRNDRKDVA